MKGFKNTFLCVCSRHDARKMSALHLEIRNAYEIHKKIIEIHCQAHFMELCIGLNHCTCVCLLKYKYKCYNWQCNHNINHIYYFNWSKPTHLLN